jgi:hypothetical protein
MRLAFKARNAPIPFATRPTTLFGVAGGSPDQIEVITRAGIEITTGAARSLVAPIRTGSMNTWRDSTISDVPYLRDPEFLPERVYLQSRHMSAAREMAKQDIGVILRKHSRHPVRGPD